MPRCISSCTATHSPGKRSSGAALAGYRIAWAPPARIAMPNHTGGSRPGDGCTSTASLSAGEASEETRDGVDRIAHPCAHALLGSAQRLVEDRNLHVALGDALVQHLEPSEGHAPREVRALGVEAVRVGHARARPRHDVLDPLRKLESHGDAPGQRPHVRPQQERARFEHEVTAYTPHEAVASTRESFRAREVDTPAHAHPSPGESDGKETVVARAPHEMRIAAALQQGEGRQQLRSIRDEALRAVVHQAAAYVGNREALVHAHDVVPAGRLRGAGRFRSRADHEGEQRKEEEQAPHRRHRSGPTGALAKRAARRAPLVRSAPPGGVAQLVEQETFNLLAGGSSPSAPTSLPTCTVLWRPGSRSSIMAAMSAFLRWLFTGPWWQRALKWIAVSPVALAVLVAGAFGYDTLDIDVRWVLGLASLAGEPGSP